MTKRSLKTTGVLALAFGIVLALAGSKAQAQGNGSNTFRPSPRAHDGFTVNTASDQGKLGFDAQLYIDFAEDPVEGAVDKQLSGQAVLSLGLASRVILYVGVPYHFILDGVGGGSDNGLGDIWLGSRIRLLGSEADFLQLAVQGTLNIGTAAMIDNNQVFRGMADKGINLGGRPEFIITFNMLDGRIRVPLNVGYNLVPAMKHSGIETLTYGGGLIFRVMDDDKENNIDVIAEVTGATPLNTGDGSTGFGNQALTSLEVIPGFKYHHKSGLTAGAGAGFGVLSNALTNPDWRVFGMLGYSMEGEKKPKINDKDGDGVADELDRCMDQPEDMDDYEDADGCPETDNDSDGIPDSADKCPTEAEDADGFEDTDGCPEADNDGDGVPDTTDRCPLDSGSADNRGCPIVDRDGDGINDNVDNCPDEAGSVENYGCIKKQLVEIKKDKIVILDKVYFATASTKILKRSNALLDNVAAVLNSHPEIPKVQVEGHTDSRGADDKNMTLSQGRADSVVAYLAKRGVDASRLAAVGFGETKPIVPEAKTADDHAANRRVEFNILEN